VVTNGGATGTTILPGDILNAGAGEDTLTISTAGVDPNGAAQYTIAAIQASGLETVLFNSYDTDATADGMVLDLTLMPDVKKVGTASGSATGDILVTNAKQILDVSLANSAGDFKVTYPASLTSTLLGDQTQNISLMNVSAGDLTIAGVEIVNVSSTGVKSTLADLVINDATTLNITGDKDLKITAAIDFKNASSSTAIDGTINASEFTGKLNVTADSDNLAITGGSGNDTINMVATFNGYDKIDGGDGSDTLTMDAATLTTQFAQTSNIEHVAFNASASAVALDVSKLSAGVESVTVNLNDAADGGNAKLASTVTKADGMLVNIAKTVEDAADANDSDGTKLTITDTTDTLDDTVNIKLSNIGRDNHATTDYFGIDEIDVATYETINITANANALGTNLYNEVEALTATVAKTITVNGTGSLETVLSGTKVTSFDASGLAGALTLTAGSEKATYSMGGKSSTIVFGSNLNASDTVIGGAGVLDTVTASASGLSSSTGALKISDVEYVLLTTGGANTLNLSGTSGLANLAVTDYKQTITGLDLATTTVHLGLAADESATSSEIDVTAADATGTDDTLKVIVNATAGAPTSIIDASDIENLSLTVGRSSTGTNNTTTLDMTTFEGNKVTLGTAALASGATVTAGTVDLGTLHKNTTTLISTNKAAVTASMTNATSVVTFEGLGTGVQTITGGLRGDTFTIGATGNITHAITGGSGSDTTNITVASTFVNAGSIDTETINMTVVPSADVTLSTSFGTGVDNVNLTGGNELSTFTTGTIVDQVKSVDASAFGGNIVATVADNKLDSTVNIKGGVLATDEVVATLATDGTYIPSTAGVEIIDADINGDVTVDLSGTSGVSRVEVDVANSKTAKVSNIVSEEVRVAAVGNTSSVVEAIPVDATESDNSIKFYLKDDNTIVSGAKLKTTDVETVSITSYTAENVDLSLLTMTKATDTIKLNLYTSTTTYAGITLSATSAQTTTIDASLAYGVTQTGRSATTAVNYTGSAGNDTFIMKTAGDNISGGGGTGDILDVDYAAVLGGISIDLSSTGQQISTLDGGAISGSITGFESVDLSGYTGGFGSVVTAIKTGSTITGTSATDRITGGAGADTIVLTKGNDVIAAGTGADKLRVVNANNGGLIEDNDAAGNKIDLNAGTIGWDDAASVSHSQTVSGITIVDLSGQADLDVNMTVKGGAASETIITGAGSDAIDLTVGGTDTVKFASAGSAESDTITGFTAGTDVLDFSAFKTIATVAGVGTGTADAFEIGGAGAAATGDVIVAFEDSADGTNANTLATGDFGTGAGKLNITKGVVLYATNTAQDNSAKADTTIKIYYVDASLGGASNTLVDDAGDILLVGTMSGVTGGVEALLAANVLLG